MWTQWHSFNIQHPPHGPFLGHLLGIRSASVLKRVDLRSASLSIAWWVLNLRLPVVCHVGYLECHLCLSETDESHCNACRLAPVSDVVLSHESDV